MKRAYRILCGFFTGLVNALLGAGGGLLAVWNLRRDGLEQTQAQANAVAVMLPLTVVSAGIYLYRGAVSPADVWRFVPGGIVGAALGSILLKRMPQKALRKGFACLLVWAGLRLILR